MSRSWPGGMSGFPGASLVPAVAGCRPRSPAVDQTASRRPVDTWWGTRRLLWRRQREETERSAVKTGGVRDRILRARQFAGRHTSNTTNDLGFRPHEVITPCNINSIRVSPRIRVVAGKIER